MNRLKFKFGDISIQIQSKNKELLNQISELVNDKGVSKTPIIMDTRWIFCNHIMRNHGRYNLWNRKRWQKYLIGGKWASYSISDMLRIFFTEKHTRESIIDCLKAPQDERHLN